MTRALTLNLLLGWDPFKLLASIKPVKWETGDFLRPRPVSTTSVSTGDGRQAYPEPGWQEQRQRGRQRPGPHLFRGPFTSPTNRTLDRTSTHPLPPKDDVSWMRQYGELRKTTPAVWGPKPAGLPLSSPRSFCWSQQT